MLDEEDGWTSMGRLEDDRGVLEAESEMDAVLETVLMVGVIVSMTLDEETTSKELEDGEVDELWLMSDDRDESTELLVELEASVVGVTDAEDDWTLEEEDETDELLSVLDAATELGEEDGLSDDDADGVAEDEFWSTLLLDAAEEELELWTSDDEGELSGDKVVTTLEDTSDEEDGRSDVATGVGVADGQFPSKSLYVHVNVPGSKETVWHEPEMTPIVSQIIEQAPSCWTWIFTSVEVQATDEIDEDDAEELMSIDDEGTPVDDGVAETLNEGDSEADDDPEDEGVSAVEDTELSREMLAADDVTALEVVEDGLVATFEDDTMLDELELSADELPVELAVDEMSELITDWIVLDAEDDWTELEIDAEDDWTELELDAEGVWTELELDVEDDCTELELGVEEGWPELVAGTVVDDIALELTLEAKDDMLNETEVDALDEVDERAVDVEALLEHVPKPGWHPIPQ
jgi:hypothetical protein